MKEKTKTLRIKKYFAGSLFKADDDFSFRAISEKMEYCP